MRLSGGKESLIKRGGQEKQFEVVKRHRSVENLAIRSFVHTAHSFAFSALSAALTRSRAHGKEI